MDKLDKSIARLKEAADYSEMLYGGAPLIVTTSGGKDSDVCIQLAKMSGIKFEVLHNHTTADAPETVRYVRQQFKKLEEGGIKCTIAPPEYKNQPTSMWKLIPEMLMPPTRLSRYCCRVLKERGGTGRFITTGVRWAESNARKKRAVLETVQKKNEEKILLNDNDDRRMFETCQLKAKRVCNPIIDWTDEEVWSFLKDQKIEGNPLYQCGFHRVGCIGCPMAGKKSRMRTLNKWSKYKDLYIHAFDRMLEERKRRGLQTEGWKNGESVYLWWIDDKNIEGQEMLEGF